jgi:hypothetical protein
VKAEAISGTVLEQRNGAVVMRFEPMQTVWLRLQPQGQN